MRRVLSVILCAMLLASLAMPVSAASAGSFLMQEYDIATDTICCYGKRLPAGGYLSVSAGSQILKNVAISTLEEAGIPVTIYCLVDSATSVSDVMKKQREDFLLNISSLMSENDSMVLGFVDENLEESAPIYDKDVRDTAIKTIEGRSWMTNLYDGIHQAMDNLLTNTTYYTNRCLVIISDGHDDGNSKTKPDDLIKQIQEAGIPVYTVVLAPSNMSQKELEYQEQFAQASLGGVFCYPDKEDISPSMAAHKLWENVKSATTVLVDAKELDNKDTDQQLLIRYEVGDIRYEDSIIIRAVDLAGIPDAAETVPAISEDTEEDKKVDEEDPGLSTVAWICIGTGVFVAIAGVVAYLLLRKKPEPMDVYDQPDVPFVQNSDNPFEDDVTASLQQNGISPLNDWGTTVAVENRCHVFAVAIMHPEVSTDFYLTPNMEITFGRTNKADIIFCEGDKKLSGLHGAFHWDGKMLLVRDMNSKNGTAVNGEKCPENVWLRLEDGATLRVGNYEYRVNFQSADMDNK